MLVFDALFWYGAFRYFRRVSTELSQYAKSPIKSPSTRAGIVSLSGFGLAAIFVLSCNLQTNYMSTYINGSEISPLTFIIVLLSVCSPLFNYLALCSFQVLSGQSSLTLQNASTLLVYTIAFVPSGYVLYKTRKEIELRLQAAIGSPPKRLYDDLKLKIHGSPLVQGIIGAIHGLVLFPVYLYQDLFKARLGTLTYQDSKIVGSKATGDKVTLIRSVRTVTLDVGEDLQNSDEENLEISKIPVCPKCKRPLIFLRDQEKFWCEKCRRARYVKSKTTRQ